MPDSAASTGSPTWIVEIALTPFPGYPPPPAIEHRVLDELVHIIGVHSAKGRSVTVQGSWVGSKVVVERDILIEYYNNMVERGVCGRRSGHDRLRTTLLTTREGI
jgi:hypothetical protein